MQHVCLFLVILFIFCSNFMAVCLRRHRASGALSCHTWTGHRASRTTLCGFGTYNVSVYIPSSSEHQGALDASQGALMFQRNRASPGLLVCYLDATAISSSACFVACSSVTQSCSNSILARDVDVFKGGICRHKVV